MCLTGCFACTHAAQILHLTREPEDEDGPLGCPNHPFSDTHLSSSSLPPSRWMTLQPAGVSCAEGSPPFLLHTAPQSWVRRRSVNQRLFIAGTLRCPESQPSLAPSVPGALTQKQGRQGGFPTDPLQPPRVRRVRRARTWDRRQIDHSGSLDSVEETRCTVTVSSL